MKTKNNCVLGYWHWVKYDQEYLGNIDRYNSLVKNLNFSWQNLEGKLEVKNCPNLTSLVVNNCQLEELIIENFPDLELLSFQHNKIEEIDLVGLEKLDSLYYLNNKLKKLDLSKNLSLKYLVCNNNSISELIVRYLE